MMGFVVRGDNLKRRMRLSKRFTCLLLAAFITLSTAVTPYASALEIAEDSQSLPAEQQLPLVTTVSGDILGALETMPGAPSEAVTAAPTEPAVTDMPAVTSFPEASGELPSVTDTADVPVQPQPDVTDITEPSDVTDITDPSDVTDITDPSDITDATEPSDTTDIPDDSGELPSDISDILDEELNPDDSFIDEDGITYFVLTRETAGAVTCTVGVNSSGYYTLLVQGNGEVPSDILEQPDIQPYKDLISKIEIRSGVTSIGENAFRGLTKLIEVRFADDNTLMNISTGAFADCPLLTTINLESCKMLTSIGNTDTIIAEGQNGSFAEPLRAAGGAFSGTGLTRVTLPASLQNLGNYTFYNCKSLTDVCFEPNANQFTFGADVFEQCTALKNINLEALSGNIITKRVEILEKYSQGLFYNCDSLESITIPSGFGYNGSPLLSMFNDCDRLTSINFMENHNITGKNNQIDNIISGSTWSLQILDLRNLVSLTEIGDYNIRGDKLSVVYLPASLKTLKNQPFGDCKSLVSVVFPKDSQLTEIGNSSFNHDDNLVSVNLENTKVQTIGRYAFQDDYALTKITFPETLTKVDFQAFQSCTALSEIDYNAADLRELGTSVFQNANTRIKINVGSSVKFISGDFLRELDGHVGEFTFEPGCNFKVNGTSSVLAKYDTPFKASGNYVTDEYGNLYRIVTQTNAKILVMANKNSSGTFTVPADVTRINEYAFKDCPDITTIDFANITGIKTLEPYAFADCENLTTLTANGVPLTDEQLAALKGKCKNQGSLFVNTKISGSSSGDGICGTPKTTNYDFHDLQLSADKYYGDTADALLTGQVWTVTAGVSNQEAIHRYRLYVKCEDKCELQKIIDGGEIYSGPHPTDNPNIYYYQINDDKAAGNTISLKIPFSYPNGTAPGKKIQVWAVQGDVTSFGSFDRNVIYPDGTETDSIASDSYYLQMEWTTKAQAHIVSKQVREGNRSFAMRNGQPTLTNLIYDIGITYDGVANSSLGQDNSISAEYRDVITLPEHLKWLEGLDAAIAGGNYTYTITNGSTKTATIYATIKGKEYNVCSVVLDSATDLNLMGIHLEWDSTVNSPAIIWRVKAKNNLKLPPLNAHLNIGDIIVGGDGFDDLANDVPLKIINDVDTRVSHQFSPDDLNFDQCEVDVKKNPARLSLSKEMLNTPKFLGEDVKYRITLENNTSITAKASDLSEGEGELVLHDGLYANRANHLQVQYIKPENIVELFKNPDSDYLKLVITQAVLTSMNNVTTKEVITVDGDQFNKVTLTPQNTAAIPNNYGVSYNPNIPEEAQLDERHECLDTPNVITKNAVITIEKVGGSQLKVTIDKGDATAASEATISLNSAELKNYLDNSGYIVTPECQYDLNWTYPDDYVFKAGEPKVIEYTATVKDTFMYTPKDKHYYYDHGADPNHTIEIFNYAEIQNYSKLFGEAPVAEVGPVNVKRDMEVYKGHFVNGIEYKGGDDIAVFDGDELRYRLQIKHFGESSFEVLPCVDSMVGPQVLLAEVSKNTALADRGLPTYEYTSQSGTEVLCYVLNQPGTYKNVWLGGYHAESVTVSKPEASEGDGLKTVIKWYFKDTVPRDFDLEIYYPALVSIEYSGAQKPAEGTTYRSYSLDNTVWLNDHAEHRIYDYIGMPVSATEFKKIAYMKSSEYLFGDKQSSCSIKDGDEITYRLSFAVRGNSGRTLTNANIYDILPSTGGVFSWSQDNISISYHDNPGDDIQITYGDKDLKNKASDNSEWEISTDADGNPIIHWKDGFSINIDPPADTSHDNLKNRREAYVYVTLKFPSGDKWLQYLSEIGNNSVINTLWCDRMTSNVTHVLSNSCKAFIQKGVYETGSFGRNAYWGPTNYYRGNDRLHYSRTAISDEHSRFIDNLVTYYIVIANTGSTNLYLSHIYDVLPEGFEFYNMSSMTTGYAYYVGNRGKYNKKDNQNTTVECGWGGPGQDVNRLVTDIFDENGKRLTLLNPKVTVVDAEQKIDGRQVVEFEVTEGNATHDFPNIDERGKFLAPKQAIQFGITCITSRTNVDPAENFVTMEYLNYNDSELDIDNRKDSRNQYKTRINVNSNDSINSNDGSRESCTTADIITKFGKALPSKQKGDDVQWLTSSVNVSPGEIIPGIEKEVEKSLYKVEYGQVKEDILWTIEPYNSGTEAIYNYQIVDTLDYPLRFEGEFRYQIEFIDNAASANNSDNGGTKWILMGNTDGNTNGYTPIDGSNHWMNMFTIERNSDNDSMKIWSNKLNGGQKYEYIVLDPNNPQECRKKLNVRFKHRGNGHQYEDIYIEFKKTPVPGAEGQYQETLIVTFEDDDLAIVPKGKAIFEISSKLDTKAPADAKIGNFNNTAYLVPTQVFTKTTLQGTLTDYNGSRAIENSAQITTYSDSPTTSVKKIEEVGNADNYGLSTKPLKNKILVDSSEKYVKYTLTVTNGDDANPMEKLIIIDNLPDVNDSMTIAQNTPRNSEFAVSLANNPEFTVKVTPKNGTERTLSKDQYTVQYLASTSFDRTNIGNSLDWQGENAAKWNECKDPTKARSFRVVISEQIPASEKVEISFIAKLDSSAKPGQIAWNSFGYCFETTVGSQTTTSWLYAAPLMVGVGLPELPDIQKKCVISNNDGKLVDYSLPSEETFKFYIYEGERLTAFSDENKAYTEDEILNALSGMKYDSFVLKVSKDSSTSEKKPLHSIISGGLEWKSGTTYTIIEAAKDDYVDKLVDYTFVYKSADNLDITIQNTRLNPKSIELTKVNRTDHNVVLQGAVFGLYSSKSTEGAPDPSIAEYENQYGTLTDSVKKIDYSDGKTYYLCKIATTDADGKISFTKLYEKDYIIKELKAPEGYYLIPAQSVHPCDFSSSNHLTMTIENRKKALMPSTGGKGCGGIVAVGALLVIISAAAFAIINRRRAEEQKM